MAATERDQRLAAVFGKTYREHLGWGKACQMLLAASCNGFQTFVS